MADIIKIKPKKKYEWNQDKKFVYFQIQLPAQATLKKIDIYVSDLVFKATQLDKKRTHFLDLLHEVDDQSPENKFVITNGLLHGTLRKKQSELEWAELIIQDISLNDLKARRQSSRSRYQQAIKLLEQNKQKLSVKYSSLATQEVMNFQNKERDILDEKKTQEKEKAIKEVFSNINEKTGKIQKPIKSLQLQRQQHKWNMKEQLALQLLNKEEEEKNNDYRKLAMEKNESKMIEEVKKKYVKEKMIIQNNTMFSQEDIEKMEVQREKVRQGVEFQEIPVRKANSTNVKVNFTERMYPNLAARDHFYKEPPMPKNKTSKNAAGDLQSKNPLWLKDKGDSFFKDKNYISAIQAYSQAIKLDSKLLKAYLNRSLSYLKVFKILQCISDCDQCQLLMKSQISNEEDSNHSRETLIKIKLRKSMCLAWKGQLQASKTLLNEILQYQMTQQIKLQVNSCLQSLKTRQESHQYKLKGDQQVKVNNYEKAINYYDRSVELDQNQYAISNKVLCWNKLKSYRQAVTLAERGIKKIISFNVSSTTLVSKQEKNNCTLLLKLYYRKAKAHEQLGQMSESQQNIRKGITINSEDKDLQEYLKAIKKIITKQTIKKIKEDNVILIKQNKILQALQNYSKCLKLLQQNEDIMQYLAILQNQCVCYQKIEKYDDVLLLCIRIIKLINNIESKVLAFGGKKEEPIRKEDLRKILMRTFIRRSNAYLKTSQYYNAKSDLEKALELSTTEQESKELRSQLEKLTETLTVSSTA